MADEQLDAVIGSVAEETARLLRVLGQPTPPGSPAPGPDGGCGHDHSPGAASACSWCPLCRGVDLVRGLAPETLRSLADVATLAAGTLADLASRRAAAPDAGESPPPRSRTPVEDITVTTAPSTRESS